MSFGSRAKVIAALGGSVVLFTALLAILFSLSYTTPPSSEEFFPHSLPDRGTPALSAEAYFVVFVSEGGTARTLLERNADEVLAIASVTKLMTALVAAEEFSSTDTVTMSERALQEKGASGVYESGQMFRLEDALHAILIASHNEMADAIAEKEGKSAFVAAMNGKAAALELSRTGYVNPVGVDPAPGEAMNHSTARDVYRLMRYIAEEKPDILSITRKESYRLTDANGVFITELQSTNKLLGEEHAPFSLLGGKTGDTPRAKQNLVIAADTPCRGRLYAVVLGSEAHFRDMRGLLAHLRSSYDWSCSR